MYRLILIVLAASAAMADVRVKSQLTAGGQTTETAIYTKGSRQRLEYGKETVILQQCDLKRMIQINNEAKSYLVVPTDESAVGAGAGATSKKGGLVTVKTTVNDTGERKEMFGLEARRIKSTVIRTPAPEACDQSKDKIETDGWYVDLDATLSCSISNSAPAAGGCSDEVRTETAGTGKLGYPLSYTMTTTGSDNKPHVVTMGVTELSRDTLDASLFDAPAAYKQQGSAREMMAAVPKSGPVRVGIPPVADRSGRVAPGGLDGALMSGLGQAKIEAIPLRGGTPQEIAAHARETQCDYILLSEITEVKKPGGGGKRFGGLMARTGLVNQKEALEARVDYRLVKTDSEAPVITSAAVGKTGGTSFNLMGAVNLGFTVANLMMMPGMMGGGMFNANLVSSLLQMKSAGMYGGGMNGMGGTDPALGGLQFMMQQNPFAGGTASPASENEAVTAALNDAAKAVASQLKKGQ